MILQSEFFTEHFWISSVNSCFSIDPLAAEHLTCKRLHDGGSGYAIQFLGSSAQDGLNFSGRTTCQCFVRFSPYAVVIASQNADRPIAAKQQAIRAKAFKREVNIWLEFGSIPIRRGCRVQARYFAIDVRISRRVSHLVGPRRHLAFSNGWLS